MHNKSAGSYAVAKDSTIFLEGQKIQSLNILLKGKVDVFLTPEEFSLENEINRMSKSFRIFSVDSNIFIGTLDLFLKGQYSLSYHCVEDSNFFAYPIQEQDQYYKLLQTQKDYSSLTIISISTMLSHLYTALSYMETRMKSLCILADNLTMLFWLLREKYKLSHLPISEYWRESREKYQQFKNDGLLPEQMDIHLLEQEIPGLTDMCYTPLSESTYIKLEYYKNILALPLQIKKDFFNANSYIAHYHFSDAAQTFDVIKNHLKNTMSLCIETFKRIYCDGEDCIFSELVTLTREAKKFGSDTTIMIPLMDDLILKIANISNAFQSDYLYDFNMDLDYLKMVISQLKETVNDDSIDVSVNGSQNLPSELMDSAEQIIRYSEISQEQADIMRESLLAYRQIKSLQNTDISARSLSRTITPLFFEIYERVLNKVIVENNPSRLLEMFLTYGYMDENLMHPEQVLTLYKLTDKSDMGTPCRIYSMSQWLHEIYDMKKDPSINEFGLDYFDTFREKVKRREAKENDKNQYNNDKKARLKFEIENMFKTNHRLCYGQLNYFPILNSDMIARDLSKALITREKVNEMITKILQVDYSAFHREVFYNNPNTRVEKELISKAVAPEIILIPIFGNKGSVWQDITGKMRSTPGRLILPVFTSENIEDILMKMIGTLRWELCRTMMGLAWNDITVPSLTSEYSDYIQFYKKNKDLSEDAKEKIRSQIQKHSNQLREIFTADYLLWIKHESKGNMRLNKVVRSILYKYCPFNKSIREKLSLQPTYNELAIPFNTAKSKEAGVLERRYNKLLQNNVDKDPVLLENLNFYKEM